MSLADRLQTELAAQSGGPCAISVVEGALQLTCELARFDMLACELTQFEVHTKQLAGAAMDELCRLSDELTARLTYLLEPIGPVERDDEKCVVQMRSKPPQQDDDGTQYYELLVRRGGELTLLRYQKQPGQIRRPVPAVVTQEVLLRLAGDFEAVLA